MSGPGKVVIANKNSWEIPDYCPPCGKSNTQTDSSKNILGRIWTRLHPVQFTTGTGCLYSAITTVFSTAAAYFTNPSQTNASAYTYAAFSVSIFVGGVSLCVTASQFIALIYLCAWKPQKAFEQNVKDLGKETELAEIQITKLHEEILQLQDLNKNLKLQLSTEKSQFEQQNISLRSKTEEIENLTHKISTIEDSLKVAQSLAAKWQEAAKTISNVAQSFSTKHLDEDVLELNKDISELDNTSKIFTLENSELKEVVIDIEEQNKTLETLIQKLSTAYQTIFSDIQNKQKLLKDVTEQVNKLEKSIQELSDENQQLKELKEKTEKLATQYKEANLKLTEMSDLLKDIDINQIKEFLNKDNIS